VMSTYLPSSVYISGQISTKAVFCNPLGIA
jgi:hypothetical protein